jgi:hypothetical protein
VRKQSSDATTLVGRSPRATNWSSFLDGHLGGRDPGQWPTLLRRAWEPRAGEPTEPYPYGPDNMQSRGARASQYSS